MSDNGFWDTYDLLSDLDDQVAGQINAWDDAPTLTGEAMTAADWDASQAVRTEKAWRYIGLSERWGDPSFLPSSRSREL